jgi:hypothetical protein
MRTYSRICALALLLACSDASAQPDPQLKRPSSSPPKGVGTRALGHFDQFLHARITTWYEDCTGWSAASHMSQRDYEHTCLQMAREHIKFLDDEAKTRMRAR